MWYVWRVRVPSASRERRLLTFAAVPAVALCLQCNTYTPDLLTEPLTVEPESPAEQDDDGPVIPATDTPSPEPEACAVPPCDDPSEPEPAGPVPVGPEPAMEPVSPMVPGPTGPAGPAPTGPDTPLGGSGPTGTGGAGGTGEASGGVPPVPAGGSGTMGGSPSGGSPAEPEPDGDGGDPPVVVPVPLSPTLIENFEDGNNTLLKNQSRKGYWYTAGSDEGTISPPPTDFETAELDTPNPALDDSEQALHLVFSDFAGDETSWALAGVALNDGDPYEAAANYAGILVWARSDDSGTIAVRLPTVSTDADDDHFGIEVDLEPEWRAYYVPFDRLMQQGFGEEQTFDPAEILEIQFALPPATTELDVWIDDIEFKETAPTP